MRRCTRFRTLLVLHLAWQLLFRVAPAGALATDNSTLPNGRGLVQSSDPGAQHATVSPFTGDATFEIPIAVPPATGGMAPNVALRYSSQSRSDSWVGYGWTLGLSAISRSLEAGIPAYDDAQDTFLLDGEELIPLDPSDSSRPREYRTRRESFLRVIHESDGTWTVLQPGGARMRYGMMPASQVGPGGSDVFQWMLSEQEDLHGNVFMVRYTDHGDAGAAYPDEIRYTMRRQPDGSLQSLDGDPSRDRVINFQVAPAVREDQPVNYTAGFKRELSRTLESVEVRVGGELLRRYEMSADSFRTLLESVSLFGADADAGVPTAPLVWTGPNPHYS
ncbi:MAG: hypothetical protein M5U32_00055 [Myxococcota bacterium]|nr:hypothetical protein [Myxococcota bacterium]